MARLRTPAPPHPRSIFFIPLGSFSQSRFPPLLLLALLAGCLPTRTTVKPDYARIVADGVANLSRQKSFSYHQVFRTAGTEAEFRGQCLVGQGEHVRGVWKYPADTVRTEIIAIFNTQYERKGGDWDRHNRGEEANIMVQVDRALKRDRFEFVREEGGRYLYSFRPNLVFLDPMMKKELRAEIGVNRSDHRPAFVRAISTDSTVFWRVELADYNRLEVLNPPRPETKRFQLVTDSLDDDLTIGQRLQQLNIRHSITRGPGRLYVELPEATDKPLLAELLSPGEFAVYNGTGLAEGNQVSAVLDTVIMDRTSVKQVAIGFDKYGAPVIRVSCFSRRQFSTPLALVVDRKVLAVKHDVDKPLNLDRIDFSVKMDYLAITIAVAKINTGPIKPLTISEAE